MFTQPLDFLTDVTITVLLLVALVFTCASMIPPRLPHCPRSWPPGR
ncbi:hypothetical protein [Saccharothrix sp.]|nr:hypothetical protein [Saccharothrix sp.]